MIFSGRFQAELCSWCTDLHNRAEEAGRVWNAPENSEVMQRLHLSSGSFSFQWNMSAACVSWKKKLIVLQCSCRLYEQLEEVKQQRTVKVRQDVYAKNRMKAKEFHKVDYLTPFWILVFNTLCLLNEYFHVLQKTLQKLRAKPSLQWRTLTIF